MSMKALPMLFIDLGGEMIYILHQRLYAQKIETLKAQKVLNDIISTMFNKRFMDELFKPQELHSKKAMRTVFDRLAHASIMRLNAASMDKLYDLMTMAVKYQVCLVSRPRDLLLITLNHLDGIRQMVETQPAVIETLDSLYTMFIEYYGNLSDGEFQLIRQSLLAFFQDMHVRVSIFLKENKQNQYGHFILPPGGAVPYGSCVPGVITLFDRSGNERAVKEFSLGGPPYVVSKQAGSTELIGERRTKLGCNMYANTMPCDTTTSGSTKHAKDVAAISDLSVPDALAKAQLDLLSRLIGSSAAPQGNFRLNLFSNDQEEESYEQSTAAMEEGTEFVSVDARKRERNAHLLKVMGDLEISRGAREKDDDLLDLMDQA